jgi:hypothetical protein
VEAASPKSRLGTSTVGSTATAMGDTSVPSWVPAVSGPVIALADPRLDAEAIALATVGKRSPEASEEMAEVSRDSSEAPKELSAVPGETDRSGGRIETSNFPERRIVDQELWDRLLAPRRARRNDEAPGGERRAGHCYCDWLRGQDLNLRPSGYEPDELPGCSTAQTDSSLGGF